MKKRKKLKILFWSLSSGAILIGSCYLKFGNLWTDQFDSQRLLEKAKVKLENTLIDGSTLDSDAWIYLGANKDEIIKLIKKIINNKKIKVEIAFRSWYKKLCETNNTVNIEISCNGLRRCFDVRFKNVKSNNNKPYGQWNNNQSYNGQDDIKKLEKIKIKLEATLIDGSMLDELIPIELQQNKILELMHNFDDNLKCFKIKFTLPEQNLSQTNSVVDISIDCIHGSIFAKARFKNVISYSQKAIDDLISNAKNKVINNTNPLGSLILLSSSKNGMRSCIKDVIKDERIIVEILNINKIVQEDKVEIIIKISVNHKFFVNNSKKLSFKLNDEKKYRKDWWYNQTDNSKSDNSNQPSNYQQSDELDENKLYKIANASAYELVGINSDDENANSKYKNSYKLILLGLHSDKHNDFFGNWYKKIKNNNPTETFNKIYTIFSFKIFKILNDDVKEVEIILKNLNEFDNEIVTKNKIINKFCKYLVEIFKHLQNKKV